MFKCCYSYRAFGNCPNTFNTEWKIQGVEENVFFVFYSHFQNLRPIMNFENFQAHRFRNWFNLYSGIYYPFYLYWTLKGRYQKLVALQIFQIADNNKNIQSLSQEQDNPALHEQKKTTNYTVNFRIMKSDNYHKSTYYTTKCQKCQVKFPKSRATPRYSCSKLCSTTLIIKYLQLHSTWWTLKENPLKITVFLRINLHS